MKKYFPLFVFCLAIFAVGIMHSCKKENYGPVYTPPPSTPPSSNTPPITSSYTQEFQNFNTMFDSGWVTTVFSESTAVAISTWSYGAFGPVSSKEFYDSTWYGFTPYSGETGEYAYSYAPSVDSALSFSNWLITPVFKVKNGDTISFYTRGDTTGVYTDRLQVLLNRTAPANLWIADMNSIGDFTKTMFDINPSQAPGGYPTSWTRYEYIFSGLSAETNVRIGFRHFVIHPIHSKGIGIDQFHFGVK